MRIVLALACLLSVARADKPPPPPPPFNPTPEQRALFKPLRLLLLPTRFGQREYGDFWVKPDGTSERSDLQLAHQIHHDASRRELVFQLKELLKSAGFIIVTTPDSPHDLEVRAELDSNWDESFSAAPGRCGGTATMHIEAWSNGAKIDLVTTSVPFTGKWYCGEPLALYQLVVAALKEPALLDFARKHAAPAPPKPARAPAVATLPPPAIPVEQQVREHHDKAKKAYDVGHFDEAIREWEAAYGLDAKPKLLYNLGSAYQHRGELTEKTADLKMARHLLERYQAEAKDVDVSDQLKEIDEQLRKLQH